MRARGATGAVALSIAVTASIVRCGGDGVVDVVEPPVTTVRFSALQAAVFTPRCALPGCHMGAAAPFGFELVAGRSYGNLVGVASGEVPSLLRVKPGDAAESYLVLKLEGDPRIVYDRMPFGGPYLDDATIEMVRKWIDAGAAN